MSFAVSGAVIVICLVLLVLLYFAVLRPVIAMKQEEERYASAAASCAQAKLGVSIASEIAEKISPRASELLSRSSLVTRLQCQNYKILRERLLSKGVSEHALQERYLIAASDPEYSDIDHDVDFPVASERQLRKAIEILGLSPLPLKSLDESPKYLLGQALFYDPILSGHLDRSCATCHQDHYATTDGQQVETRITVSADRFDEDVPARNVPDLWNRDHNDVAKMLWDGRLEVLESASRAFRIPKDISSSGYENLMAIQSVLPLVKPVEMLGDPAARIPSSLARNHASLIENLQTAEEINPQTVLKNIIRRLVGDGTNSRNSTQNAYAKLFESAYGTSNPNELTAAQLGNALAHFIELAFQTRDTPWDSYLKGDTAALSDGAKQGAILFYGIGRCGVCHSGDLFSDFSFHSVGVAHTGEVKDRGRFYATDDPEDLFKFRTPSLRNVTLTAPYFHNGTSETLKDAIFQHLSPYRWARSYSTTGAHLMQKEEIDAISPLLGTPNSVSETQISLIIEFLRSLEDAAAGQIVRAPESVPSGLLK